MYRQHTIAIPDNPNNYARGRNGVFKPHEICIEEYPIGNSEKTPTIMIRVRSKSQCLNSPIQLELPVSVMRDILAQIQEHVL
jgi:hypothetical protein